jgi:hypothetical protein
MEIRLTAPGMEADMLNTVSLQNHSHLFLVRLWTQEESEGHVKWQVKVQHLKSGQARFLQSVPDLVDVLTAMVNDLESITKRNHSSPDISNIEYR